MLSLKEKLQLSAKVGGGLNVTRQGALWQGKYINFCASKKLFTHAGGSERSGKRGMAGNFFSTFAGTGT